MPLRVAVFSTSGSPRFHFSSFLRAALFAVFSSGAEAMGGEVELTESVSFHRRDFVATACHNLSSVACTNFTEMRLVCACSFEEYEWRIRWAVRGKAVSFVSSARTLRHETRHVDDVRARLHAVGMKVGQARFGSEAECAKAIGAALDSFPQLMHEVIRTDVFHVDGRTMEESQILAHGH